nr:integrase, catalytic region, zinc finger, CCHC-type, peptidase aspartic, catalytic [Tanacetum cinerariifolium]
MNEEDMFGVNDLDGDEVVVDVSAGEKVEQSVKVVEKEISTADPITTAGIKVTTATTTSQISKDELTLAQTLIEIKEAKPKAITTTATTITAAITRPKEKGIVMQEPYETPSPKLIDFSQQPSHAKDKGKGKMVDPKRPLKRKDHIMIDGEVAKNLKAHMQVGKYFDHRVYFVEGLGHNLFSIGQFCDSDLEVTFRRNSCFVKNIEGVDLLKGDRSTNLYTINLHEMASASPIYLMAHASSTKSWLWHQRLSHLNFDNINDLARNDLVSGLDLTYAPSTITMQQPSEGELDLLFEAMYDDYIGSQLFFCQNLQFYWSQTSHTNSPDKILKPILDDTEYGCAWYGSAVRGYMKLLWLTESHSITDYLNDEYVAMTRSYFIQYTGQAILEVRDTLIQHLESVKKSINERVQLKREYDSRVNERQMQTTEEKVDTSQALDASSVDTESSRTESKEQDTSSRSRNDEHDDDADIRPI